MFELLAASLKRSIDLAADKDKQADGECLPIKLVNDLESVAIGRGGNVFANNDHLLREFDGVAMDVIAIVNPRPAQTWSNE